MIGVEDPRGDQGLGTCAGLAAATLPFASQRTGASAKKGAMTCCLSLSRSPSLRASLSPICLLRCLSMYTSLVYVHIRLFMHVG